MNKELIDLEGAELTIDGETHRIVSGELTLNVEYYWNANGSRNQLSKPYGSIEIEKCEPTIEMDNPTEDDDHIWTAKYDHDGETYTRDKDLMAHLEKHRDAEWEDYMMDTYEAPAAQRKLDEIIDDLESLLSDEARERWDCDECGHGGGGLCPRCKHKADITGK